MLCILYDVQGTIQRQRVEIGDFNARMMQEQQKVEQQESINVQLNGQLQDTLKERKVRLLKWHCLTLCDD